MQKSCLRKQKMLTLKLLDFNQKYPEFFCREPDINRYFNERLAADVRRSVNAAYLLYDNDSLVGFFTLSQHAVKREEKHRHKGHFSYIPATLLGQFAIDSRFCGREYAQVKYSTWLLKCALQIHAKVAKQIGSTALILNPINDTVKKKFYEKTGLFKNYESVEDNDYMYARTSDICAFWAEI